VTAPLSPRVVLVGAMGAGKSTVGRLVAEQLGTSFLDTDEVVEQETGKAVAEIFIDDGEARFRELERRAVADALQSHDGVLALGGGAVLDAATRDLLDGHPVVFLRVGLSDAAKRVGLGVSRPLLLGNVRGRIKQLLDERTPIYEAVAAHVVDTDGLTAEDVAERVRAVVEDGLHE